MKKFLFSVLVVAVFALSAMAQGATAPAKVAKPAKPAKVAKAAKSDSEIQTCINDKFKTSTSVKNGNATVSGGAATLTGEVASGGAKGGATNSAKACGAKPVTNNITVAAKVKAPKPTPAAKPADKMKKP